MIITERQRDMLTQLKGAESLSVTAMTQALGVNKSGQMAENISYNFEQLCVKGLAMLSIERSQRHGKGYAITSLGVAALRRRYVQAEPIQSDRISPMTLPEYVPPSMGYVRNNAHKHIQSRGFQ